MTVTLLCDAVLFDCDGVLVDSKAAGEIAWTEWSNLYGLDSALVLKVIHGRRTEETVARFVSPTHVREATAKIEQIELLAAAETQAIAGALSLLQSFDSREMAVVTSGPRRLCIERLRAAGLPVPPTIVAAGDVSHGKPAAEPYLKGAAALQVELARCVVFEDSDLGIQAAHAAKVKYVVGVGVSALRLGCSVVVPDLSCVSWRDSRLQVSRSGLLEAPHP